MHIKTMLTLNDFEEMEKLERKYYDDDHITPFQEAWEWYCFAAYSAKALECEGKIAGFMDLYPVTPETFAKLKAGRLNDKYLTTKNIVPLETLKPGDRIDLFLCCVVIDEPYRKTNALSLLLDAYIKEYQALTGIGVLIDSIVTDNVTDAGCRFSERLGFTKACDSDHNSVIYTQKWKSFIRHGSGKRLS